MNLQSSSWWVGAIPASSVMVIPVWLCRSSSKGRTTLQNLVRDLCIRVSTSTWSTTYASALSSVLSVRSIYKSQLSFDGWVGCESWRRRKDIRAQVIWSFILGSSWYAFDSLNGTCRTLQFWSFMTSDHVSQSWITNWCNRRFGSSRLSCADFELCSPSVEGACSKMIENSRTLRSFLSMKIWLR